jgi:hypothetical protein
MRLGGCPPAGCRGVCVAVGTLSSSHPRLCASRCLERCASCLLQSCRPRSGSGYSYQTAVSASSMGRMSHRMPIMRFASGMSQTMQSNPTYRECADIVTPLQLERLSVVLGTWQISTQLRGRLLNVKTRTSSNAQSKNCHVSHVMSNNCHVWWVCDPALTNLGCQKPGKLRCPGTTQHTCDSRLMLARLMLKVTCCSSGSASGQYKRAVRYGTPLDLVQRSAWYMADTELVCIVCSECIVMRSARAWLGVYAMNEESRSCGTAAVQDFASIG